jgi:hypothetical protein
MRRQARGRRRPALSASGEARPDASRSRLGSGTNKRRGLLGLTAVKDSAESLSSIRYLGLPSRGAQTLFRTLTPFNLPVGGSPGGPPAKPDSAQEPLSAARPLRASLPLPLRRTAQGGGQSDRQTGLAKGTRHPNSGASVLRPLPLRVATTGLRLRRPSIPAREGPDRRSVHRRSAVSLASTKEAGWHPGQPRHPAEILCPDTSAYHA